MATKKYTSKYFTNAEIDQVLNNAANGAIYLHYDDAGTKAYYRIFSVGPEEERATRCNAWLEARNNDTMADEINAYMLGYFEAPAPYNVKLTFTSDQENYIRSGATGNAIAFSFKTTDSSGSELQEAVQVVYSFNNSGSVQSTTKIYNSGEEVSMNIDKYLSVGTNTITMTVTGRSTGASAIYILHYYVVEMTLTSSFNVAVPRGVLGGLTVPYALASSSTDTKYIEFYIDGTLVETKSTTDTSIDTSVILTTPSTPGKHHLQIRAYVGDTGSKFYSQTLYREFVVTGDTGSYIMVAIDLDPETLINETKANLYLTAEQYVQTNITWGYYNSTGASGTVKWSLGGENIRSIEAAVTDAESNAKPYTLSFVPTTSGTLELAATVNGDSSAYALVVQVNKSGISEATEGLELKLQAVGRSNGETATDRCVWESGDIQAEFPTGWAWSEQQGWVTDDDEQTALAISGGKQVTIPFAPFSNAPQTYGCTFEIEFETYDVDDEDATVISVWGKNSDGNECGVKITAEGALFQSANGLQMITKFKQSERIKLAFVINRIDSNTFPHLAFILNNGVYERAIDYTTGGTFSNSANIILGDSTGKASVKIYNIRAYQTALTVQQELYNSWIDSGEVATKIIENDIYSNGIVSVEKMQGVIPVMLVDGLDDAYNNISTLEGVKDKDTKINVNVKFYNGSDTSKNFTITGARMKLQGTSSLGYPRKNFKLYSKKDDAVMTDYEGNTINKGLYAFNDGDVPVNCWTLKADFMDSSCTRNATVARLFGDIEPDVNIKNADGDDALKTPPQLAAQNYKSETGYDFPYNLRTTPNGLAIVMFHKKPNDTQYTFLGQYTLLNDKSNEYVYGFHSIYIPTSKATADEIATIIADPMCMYMKDSVKDALVDSGHIERLYDNEDCHCYEILDNVNEFSNFNTVDGWETPTQVDAGDTFKHCGWEAGFESRYPEIDDGDFTNENERIQEGITQGAPLKAFIEWMLSCYDTADDGESTYMDGTLFNLTRFEAEMENHLNLYFCAAYYVYLIRWGAVDQVKKNMMWTTYGNRSSKDTSDYSNLIWFPIRYDNDTTVDDRNDGTFFYNYKFLRDDLDPSTQGAYYYSGHDSLLWNALEQSDAFMQLVIQIDTAFYAAGLTYDNVIHYYDDLARNMWCEQIYNENQHYKYIAPLLTTDESQKADYLTFLHGRDESHQHWFLRNRFDMIDAMWGSGEFANKYIHFLVPNAPVTSKIYATASKSTYFGITRNKTAVTQSNGEFTVPCDKDEMATLIVKFASDSDTAKLATGDPIYINGGNNISILDLHEFAPYFTQYIEFDKIYDTELGSNMKQLILGISDEDLDAGVTNVADIGSITGIANMTRLEYLDMKGLSKVVSFSFLTSLTSLKTLLLKGTGMTTFTCADGASFTTLQLPSSLQSMRLSRVNWQSLDYTPTSSLKYLNLDYMTDETDFPMVKAFVFQWLDMLEETYGMDEKWTDFTLVATGIDWTDVEYHRLEQLMNLGSCQLSGHSYIKCSTEYSSSQMSTLMARFGTTIFTDGSDLVLDCSSGNIILSATGDGVSVRSDGTICILQGYTATMHCTGFPIRGGAEADYQWMQGSSADSLDIVDEDGTLQFDDNTISSEGVITTRECTTPNRTYYIRVRNVNSLAQSVVTPVYIYQRAYPEAVELSEAGNKWDGVAGGYHQITSRGHAKVDTAFTPSAFDGNIESVTWSLLQNDGETSYSDTTYVQKCADDYLDGKTDFTEFCLNVKSMPSDDIQLALRYAAVMVNGSEVESPLFRIAIISVIAQALLNIDEGNVPLFGRLDSLGVEHANANWYSSLELRAITNVLDLSGLTDLTSFNGDGNKVTNVLVHLKNCLGLNLSGCTALLQADCYNMQQMRSLDVTGTSPMLEVRLPSSGSITIAASANGSGTQPSVFVTDADAYRESIDGQSDECIEPVSDWGRTALMWDDGTRIRFDDDSTALLD